MDTQLLVKIIHMSAAGLAIVAILARAITLFGGVSKSMLKKSRLDFDKIEKCE